MEVRPPAYNPYYVEPNADFKSIVTGHVPIYPNLSSAAPSSISSRNKQPVTPRTPKNLTDSALHNGWPLTLGYTPDNITVSQSSTFPSWNVITANQSIIANGFNQLPPGYTPANYADKSRAGHLYSSPNLTTINPAQISSSQTHVLSAAGQLPSHPTQTSSFQLQDALQNVVAAARSCMPVSSNGTAISSGAGVILEPFPQEVKVKKMVVQYLSGADLYVRLVTRSATTGWRSGIYSENNVFRHVLDETRKAYLARLPGIAHARIEWRFDLTNSGTRIKKLRIKFITKVQNNARGCVNAYVVTGNQRTMITRQEQKLDHLKGHERFSLVAELYGGSGQDAWENAQLFRQSLENGNPPFEVTIWLV